MALAATVMARYSMGGRWTAAAGTRTLREGDHLVGAFWGTTAGPTLIVVGSIHGNEPAGTEAMVRVVPHLERIRDRLRGRVFLLTGNTRALAAGYRYLDTDLNRSWTPQKLALAPIEACDTESEANELAELDHIIDPILVTAEDEVYVIDLHSTSADGVPFATVGDTLRNREFAQKLPVTILLGVEEQLEGTMLEYLNNAGCVTLGFEGGQHLARNTVDNHEALIWTALAASGIADPVDVPDLATHRSTLARGGRTRIYEVRYRHPVIPADDFRMLPGFQNFDTVRRGQPLATDACGDVTAAESGVLLMPLYQRLGEDGFFIGREVARFWLAVSGVLRRLKIQNLMHLLPGVHRDENDPETYLVDTRIARLFPLQVFHLLGFRRRRWSGDKLVVSRRKHDTASPFKRRSA